MISSFFFSPPPLLFVPLRLSLNTSYFSGLFIIVIGDQNVYSWPDADDTSSARWPLSFTRDKCIQWLTGYFSFPFIFKGLWPPDFFGSVSFSLGLFLAAVRHRRRRGRPVWQGSSYACATTGWRYGGLWRFIMAAFLFFSFFFLHHQLFLLVLFLSSVSSFPSFLSLSLSPPLSF
ncbi:unnamed protein product [Acanthosepion pharaonis]|uniref:Uncharacterized protein n=1 Tax=Acanthosepion pharaonis TaxID=158019 RepID=A0A812B119_ACAPH|nr:unnamed protein product [Sepia pharaonis]